MPPSAVVPTSNNHFEALYESPWGGIASDKYATDIAPNQFVSCSGIAIKNGSLCSEFWTPLQTILSGTVFPADFIIYYIGTVGGQLFILDSIGRAWLYSSVTRVFTIDQTYPGPIYPIDDVQVINNSVYISSFVSSNINQYIPGVSYTTVENYVGGKYFTVLDGYLLLANTNQPSDSGGVSNTSYAANEEIQTDWLQPGAVGNINAGSNSTGTFTYTAAPTIGQYAQFKGVPNGTYANGYYYRICNFAGSPVNVTYTRTFMFATSADLAASQAIETEFQYANQQYIYNMAWQFDFLGANSVLHYFNYTNHTWVPTTIPVNMAWFAPGVDCVFKATFLIDEVNKTTQHVSISINGGIYNINVTQSAFYKAGEPNYFHESVQIDTNGATPFQSYTLNVKNISVAIVNKSGIKTGRVNWSAPYQFSTWDPAVNRQAGYNVLADVEDVITGILSLGNVGYVLRTNGITQLTPTGIAIQPFTFTTLLSGNFGVGCSYPDTVARYGDFAAFGDSSDFYLFSGGTPQPICGAAKRAIYADINSVSDIYSKAFGQIILVSAAFHNTAHNSINPEVCYTICIVNWLPNNPGSQSKIVVAFWTYNLKLKTWMRNIFDLGTYIGTKYGASSLPASVSTIFAAKIIHVKYPPLNPNNNSFFTFPVFYFTGLIWIPTSQGTFTAKSVSEVIDVYQCQDGQSLPSLIAPQAPISPISIVFKKEEVKFGRQVTISRVVIRAAGYGTLLIQVGNTTFSPIVVGPVGTSMDFTYLTSSGMVTALEPQLQINSSNFYGTINKVMMVGTYAEGDIS